MVIEHTVRWLTTLTVAIEWTINGVVPSNSLCVVQRSESPNEGFVDISSPIEPIGVMSFIDQYPPNISELGTYYYKVQLVDIATDDVLKDSTVKQPRRDRPKIALEIVRRNNLLLKRFVGIRGFLLNKKDSGTRCAGCWDSIKERRSKSHCSECGDTGWISGLSTPIPIFLASNSPTESQTVNVLGASENISRTLWTSNYPMVSAGDIIILDNKEIYRVESSKPIMFRETIVSQTLNVSSVPKDREYNSIPLPDFEEFSSLDLIHRQYGGVSTDDHTDYKEPTTRLGDFSIHPEGREK